jgi:AAA+ superfamily predicted ATPase
MQSRDPPDPSSAQLRRAVVEQVAIPLATGLNVTASPRVFLFYGPRGTGKSMMAHAVCNDTNALYLELSTDVFGDNALDKNAVLRILYSTFKVASHFQPALIFVDEIEHFFPRKFAKKFKPKCAKYKRDLVDQILKHLDPAGQVVVVLATSEPSLVSIPELKKLIARSFYFPFPDYSARALILRDYVKPLCNPSTCQHIVSLLALHTEGYSYGSIRNALRNVFTKERIAKLEIIALTAEEIILSLSKEPYTSLEDYAAFKDITTDLLDIKAKQDKMNKLQKENEPVKRKPKKPS